MRYLFLLLIVLMSFYCTGQERLYFGRVTDHQGKGIPFAVVESKGRNEGVYCNEEGFFSFRGNADSIKVLAIFCLGYEKKELSTEILPLDSIIITLQPRVAGLKEVSIKAKKGKLKQGVLGKDRKKLKYDGDCYRYYGSETAILLQSDPEEEGTLKDIFVYITNDGDYTTKFRIHVYEWDAGSKLPVVEITDSNLVVMATSGNSWVKATLADKNIPIKGGLFISVEWISGFGNNEKKLQSNINPEVTGYNGQVLGLTSDYSRESMVYFRKPFQKEWAYYDSPDAQRKFGRFLNPMIYCTYSYID